MWPVSVPSADSLASTVKMSSVGNGGLAGVVASVGGLPEATSNACLFRKLAISIPTGAISVVVSSHCSLSPSGTAVITWSNCAGEGTSGSTLRVLLISAG